MLALPVANDWEQVGLQSELVPAETQLGKSALLFSKIEDDAIKNQLDKLESTKLKNSEEALLATPLKETVSFEDFTKLDLRVGTILSAEKVAKTKKLLALKVDIGSETRTIVSGIAEDYSAEEVVGKTVSVLVNLAPRTLRGVESQGMILMTENAEGKLVFITPSEADSQPGLTIR